mgnify:CR=1 FL=1
MQYSQPVNSATRTIPNIKQSVINTFNRVGINYKALLDQDTGDKITVNNRFGGGSCEVSPLVARLIEWVYSTSYIYEVGIQDVRLDDFDRIRYFILEIDSNAYTVCID